jgi:hypothetical protein
MNLARRARWKVPFVHLFFSAALLLVKFISPLWHISSFNFLFSLLSARLFVLISRVIFHVN